MRIRIPPTPPMHGFMQIIGMAFVTKCVVIVMIMPNLCLSEQQMENNIILCVYTIIHNIVIVGAGFD